jgi:hypothetical protein
MNLVKERVLGSGVEEKAFEEALGNIALVRCTDIHFPGERQFIVEKNVWGTFSK